MTVVAKRAMIELDHSELSVRRQCDLLGLARSSYYRELIQETPENLTLMRFIDETYLRYPFYGARKMRDHLRRQGYPVNRKRIQRLMRVMGLQSIAPKKRTSIRNTKHKIYPFLLRGHTIDHPNQVWCSDITYIRMRGGFVYLTAVMDWYSRCVLSWEVSITLDDGFCVSALERALRRYPAPEIFNTDQGAQYTGSAFTGVLKSHDIKISMDGKGRVIDNIMVERLWRTLKYEDVYIKDYVSIPELIEGLREYFHFYNHVRPHSTFGGKTPAEMYASKSHKRAA